METMQNHMGAKRELLERHVRVEMVVKWALKMMQKTKSLKWASNQQDQIVVQEAPELAELKLRSSKYKTNAMKRLLG